jgi:hypothetical protein
MTLNQLITKLQDEPENVEFAQVMSVIESNYKYTPTSFKNGSVVNAEKTNEGSCKIFAFAKLNQLTAEQTLACFGQYYRDDVLQNPEGDDHGNIRNFMQSAWQGIEFDQMPLTPKKSV